MQHEARDQSKMLLRRQMRSFLASISDSQRSRAAEAACANLISFRPLSQAKVIMIYMPLPGEIDVLPAAAHWLHESKTICVPRVDPNQTAMEAVELTSLDSSQMKHDQYGVRVPKTGRVIPVAEIQAVLVPGLAFDDRGDRLGRSAGYYDRFLKRLDAGQMKVGVCFDGQIVDKVPTETHDVKMDVVISDLRITNCR